MSKIKLPHASGNSMSIGAPATNPASDLTLTLPATIGTNGQYLTVDGSGNLTWADPPGITEMDQWRLTTNTALGAGGAYLTSNWERNDTAFSKIGTGMTESSGIFTFPSTGIWQIFFNGTSSDTDKNRYAGVEIFYSTDSGSNYSPLGENWDSIHDSGSDVTYASFSGQGNLDVTNVSTFRIKVKVSGESAMEIMGSTSANRTSMTFTRLGAT